MPNRTVTFTGTVTNIGNVSTSYRVNIFALKVPLDPLESPLDLSSSAPVATLAPGATSPSVSVAVTTPMLAGDVLTNIRATLDITAPSVLLNVATPITRAPYTEPVAASGSFSGTISVASRFAAGLVRTSRGYRLVVRGKGLLKPLLLVGAFVGGFWALARRR